MIAGRYGFKRLKIVRSAGGLSAENYFALADNRYPIVIKLHKAKKEKEIKQIEVVITILSAASIPVSSPIKTIEGKQHIILNNNLISIYPKIRGKILHESDFTPTALTSTAKNLSKLHNVLPNNLQLATIMDTVVPIDTVKHQVKLLEGLIIQKSKGDTVDSAVKTLLNTKLQLLSEAMAYSEDFKKCLLSTTKLVHGDFHNQNIVFNARHGLVGILDFEEVHYGHPMEDIMHFIQLACCNTGYNQPNMDRSIFFLRQYLRYIDLSIQDIELGWYLYLYKITSSFFLESSFFNSDSNGLLPFIERDVKKFEYLYVHKQKFISELLNTVE